MEEWRPNPLADINGVGSRANLSAGYAELEALFGPAPHGEYKVSTSWVFSDPAGRVATIYDWKTTNLYDADGPSVEEFRRLPSYDWNVGALSQAAADAFLAWVTKRLSRYRAMKQTTPAALWRGE